MTISAEQVRAARAILGFNSAELAERAKVARSTVAEFEAGGRVRNEDTGRGGLRADTAGAIRQALERAGIEFIDDAERVGVALRKRRRRGKSSG